MRKQTSAKKDTEMMGGDDEQGETIILNFVGRNEQSGHDGTITVCYCPRFFKSCWETGRKYFAIKQIIQGVFLTGPL